MATVDPTAWAQARLPQQNIGTGLAYAAMAGAKIGERRQAIQEAETLQGLTNSVIDAHKSGDTNRMMYGISQMARLNPDKAATMRALFADLDRTQAAMGAYNVYGALNSPDPTVQEMLLKQAIQSTEAANRPNNPLLQMYVDALNTPAGDDRTAKMLGIVQLSDKMGLFPDKKYAGSQTDARLKRQDKLIQQYRTDIDTFGKSFRTAQEATARVGKVWNVDSPAANLALVYNFMKVNDPPSVVRESEFRTAIQARNWMVRMQESGYVLPSFVVSTINQIYDGGKMTEAQRKDFYDRTNDLFAANRESYDKEIGNILARADIDGVPRENVIGVGPYNAWVDRTSKREKDAAEVLGVPSQNITAKDKPEKILQKLDSTLSKMKPADVAEKVGKIGEAIENIPGMLERAGEKIDTAIDEFNRPVDQTPSMTPGTSFELPNLNRKPPVESPYQTPGPRVPMGQPPLPPEVDWKGVYPKGQGEETPQKSPMPFVMPPRGAPQVPFVPGGIGSPEHKQMLLDAEHPRIGPSMTPQLTAPEQPQGMTRVAPPSVVFKTMEELEKRGIDPQYIGIDPEGNLIIFVEGEGWIPFDLGVQP